MSTQQPQPRLTGEFVYITEELAKRPGIVAYEVQEDTMAPEVARGDVVLLVPPVAPEDGALVMAKVAGRPALRWYWRSGDAIVLSAENEGPRRVPAGTKVWAVVGVVKRL